MAVWGALWLCWSCGWCIGWILCFIPSTYGGFDYGV